MWRPGHSSCKPIQVGRMGAPIHRLLQNCGSYVWKCMLPFWRIEFGSGFQIFGKFVNPCMTLPIFSH
jgi:hypothetical protein